MGGKPWSPLGAWWWLTCVPLLTLQSVENCMCILHNLSYRLDAEVPTRYRQLEYNARNAYMEKSSTGCFSNKSDKMMVSTVPWKSQGHLGFPALSTLPLSSCGVCQSLGPGSVLSAPEHPCGPKAGQTHILTSDDRKHLAVRPQSGLPQPEGPG